METLIYCLLQFCKLIRLMVSVNFGRIVLETNYSMPIVYHVQTPLNYGRFILVNNHQESAMGANYLWYFECVFILMHGQLKI